MELHLVPVTAQRLEVRRLSQMGDELASAGRNAGLFGTGQALDIDFDDHQARAVSRPGRQADEYGIAVTRTGQRSVWLALPHDSMGAVFDPDDMGPRLTALLVLLRSLPLPDPDRVAFALRIEPLALLSFAPASTVGQRSRAEIPFASRNSCSVYPDDAVSLAAFDANLGNVADELTARLAAALRNR